MAKTGRNDPCPCGSGKKYKKCCLGKTSQGQIPGQAKKPDPDMMSSQRLDKMMQQGYGFVLKGNSVEGCKVWLEVWADLKKRFKPQMRSVEQAESVFQGQQCIYNWCQDLEMELGNAGCSDRGFYQKRIDFCLEYCRLFPKSDSLTMHNMKRAAAESYFGLDRVEEGEKAFQALAREFPDNVWSYISWGDAYAGFCPNQGTPPDYERAERIYRLGLERNIREDRDVLMERLEDLKESRRSS